MVGVLSHMILGPLTVTPKGPTTSDISEKAKGLGECP